MRYRAEYRRIAAEKGVVYVDPFRGELRFYGTDQFHLSEEGYGEWYREIRRAMAHADVVLPPTCKVAKQDKPLPNVPAIFSAGHQAYPQRAGSYFLN